MRTGTHLLMMPVGQHFKPSSALPHNPSSNRSRRDRGSVPTPAVHVTKALFAHTPLGYFSVHADGAGGDGGWFWARTRAPPKASASAAAAQARPQQPRARGMIAGWGSRMPWFLYVLWGNHTSSEKREAKKLAKNVFGFFFPPKPRQNEARGVRACRRCSRAMQGYGYDGNGQNTAGHPLPNTAH